MNDDTLQQLRSNKLLFSSADHYDDPFDTYLRIDRGRVASVANGLRDTSRRGGPDEFKRMYSDAGLPHDLRGAMEYALDHASPDVPDPSYFVGELDTIKDYVVKSCYSICFCDDPLNESLWLKYADSHMGFVQVYESDVFGTNPPPVYPVYYSDEKYDATTFAVALCTLRAIPPEMRSRHPAFLEAVKESTMWEIERISLIKRRCHEHDGEWRMIWPYPPQERPVIFRKPSYIVLGLKMPEDDRQRVISAALAAQIKSIRETYIDSEGNLSMREVDYSSDLLL